MLVLILNATPQAPPLSTPLSGQQLSKATMPDTYKQQGAEVLRWPRQWLCTVSSLLANSRGYSCWAFLLFLALQSQAAAHHHRTITPSAIPQCSPSMHLSDPQKDLSPTPSAILQGTPSPTPQQDPFPTPLGNSSPHPITLAAKPQFTCPQSFMKLPTMSSAHMTTYHC